MKKKTSNIAISSKGVLASRYFKMFIFFLLTLMLIMSVVLIKVYIDVNKNNSKKNNSAQNIITKIDNNIDEYKIYENEEGLLGITNKEDRVIVEPLWEDIYILSKNRFIVSKMFNNVKKTGIIDYDSNVIVPFIFESFKSFSNDFIGGFNGNNNNFFLFDKNGNLLVDKMWTGYKYSDKIMFLNDGIDEYRGKFIDDKFQFIYISLNRKANNIPFNISIAESEKINKIGIDNINRISDITEGYLTYLISENENDISDLTAEQYFSSLSSNDFFENCSINTISDFMMDISEEKSKITFNVKILVNYNYKKKDVNLENISSEIIFNIVKDENNRLVLKSINKTEL